MDYEALVKKIKKRRTLWLIVTIIVAVLLVVGSISYTSWVDGEEVYVYDGPIPQSTAVLVLLILFAILFFVAALNEAKVAEILNKECRPELYLAAKVALCNTRRQNSEPMRYVKMIVANALGDFAGCESYAKSLHATKNAEIRLATLVCMRNVCFARGSVAECERILQTLDGLLEQKSKDGMRKKIADARKLTLVALYLLQGNGAEAAAVADSVSMQNEPVSEVGVAYYQGLAYLAAEGREEDALYALLTIQKKGGSTWYVERTLPLLKQAWERLAKKNTIVE